MNDKIMDGHSPTFIPNKHNLMALTTVLQHRPANTSPLVWELLQMGNLLDKFKLYQTKSGYYEEKLASGCKNKTTVYIATSSI